MTDLLTPASEVTPILDAVTGHLLIFLISMTRTICAVFVMNVVRFFLDLKAGSGIF